MNQKKNQRKNKGQLQERFQSPVPNRRRQEENPNGLFLHDLSPFRPVYGTLNTAPNPVFFNTNDLAIIETPIARSQPRHYLDQVDEGFRQITGVISWQQNNNHSVSQQNQSEQSQFLSSSSSEESENIQEKIPLIIQLKPVLQRQNNKKIQNDQQSQKEIPKKQNQKEDKNLTGRRIFCNCKKTKCLKLYCDCFRENLTCTESCNCVGCHNLQSYDEERNNAMLSLMDRNPLAFVPKIDVEQHSKGCHCRKSNCLKKYCECFQAGIKCGPNCKCEQCKNDHSHEKDDEFLHKNNRTTAKKEKRFSEVIE